LEGGRLGDTDAAGHSVMGKMKANENREAQPAAVQLTPQVAQDCLRPAAPPSRPRRGDSPEELPGRL